MSRIRNALIGVGALGGLSGLCVAAWPENKLNGSSSVVLRNVNGTRIQTIDEFIRDFKLAEFATINTRIFDIEKNEVCIKEEFVLATDWFIIEADNKKGCRPIQKEDMAEKFLEKLNRFRPPGSGISRPNSL